MLVVFPFSVAVLGLGAEFSPACPRQRFLLSAAGASRGPSSSQDGQRLPTQLKMRM